MSSRIRVLSRRPSMLVATSGSLALAAWHFSKRRSFSNGSTTTAPSGRHASHNGSHIETSEIDATTTTINDNTLDCPICRKFSRGPCGTLFQTWYDCTEANPQNEVDACADAFAQFQQCLDQNEAYYSSDDSDTNPQANRKNDLSDLKDINVQWDALLQEGELSTMERGPFPPSLQPRCDCQSDTTTAPESSNITIWFPHESHLLLAMVQKPVDNMGASWNTLRAVSGGDGMPSHNGEVCMHVVLPDGVQSFRILALYADDTDFNIEHLYEYIWTMSG
jgi:hypothetical protein